MKLKVSAGAMMLFALVFFFDSSGAAAAILPAIAVHELGHVLALRLFGAQLYGLEVGILGLRLDYGGALSPRQLRTVALAGPAAGGIYAVVFYGCFHGLWRLSGQLSGLLTGFNLLPALPLDGGRMLDTFLASGRTREISCLTAAALFTIGAIAFFSFGSLSLCLMGGWLLLYNMI